MYQVLADRMAPVHILPVSFKRIVLVEQVVFALIIDQSVRVIDPASPGSEVELRTVLFLIQFSLSFDFVGLVYFTQSLLIAVVGYLDRLSFESRHIFKHPVFRFIRRQTDNDG